MYDPFAVRLSGAANNTLPPNYSDKDEEAGGAAATADITSKRSPRQHPKAEGDRGASAYRDRGTDATGLYTVYSPTQFTTAAGKPICLRERRELPRDCAFVRFLTIPSISTQSRSEFLAGQVLECATMSDRKRHREDEGSSSCSLPPPWVWCPQNISDTVVVLSGDGERAQSSPAAPSHCAPRSGLEEEVSSEKPPHEAVSGACMYTGFVRANGQPMLYRSPLARPAVLAAERGEEE